MAISKFLDLNANKPLAVSERRFFAPFAGDSELYLHEQDFVQLFSKFKPLALNTPDAPKYPVSFLVEETEPQPVGGGVVKWTRRYCRIPARRVDGESFSWQLPGIAVVSGSLAFTVDNAATVPNGAYTRIVTTSDHSLAVGDNVEV